VVNDLPGCLDARRGELSIRSASYGIRSLRISGGFFYGALRYWQVRDFYMGACMPGDAVLSEALWRAGTTIVRQVG
jgi:hypothetical protein